MVVLCVFPRSSAKPGEGICFEKRHAHEPRAMHNTVPGTYTEYELQFDLACDVGLKYSPRQLFRFKIKPPT
jgi:hypothetical protein